jgi:hypothetical protein
MPVSARDAMFIAAKHGFVPVPAKHIPVNLKKGFIVVWRNTNPNVLYAFTDSDMRLLIDNDVVFYSDYNFTVMDELLSVCVHRALAAPTPTQTPPVS